MYFVKTDLKSIIQCERHRIKISTLGWVRIKEKGYIPTIKSGILMKSGAVSYKAGRYYVSVLVEILEEEKPKLNDFGLDNQELIISQIIVKNDRKMVLRLPILT